MVLPTPTKDDQLRSAKEEESYARAPSSKEIEPTENSSGGASLSRDSQAIQVSNGNDSNDCHEEDDQKAKKETGTRRFGPNIYSKHEYIFVIAAGVSLTFNSGYINGACLSGFLDGFDRRQSVMGYTGAYTKSALELADGNISSFGFQTCMILSFMLGACIAGFMNPNPKPYQIVPSYGPTFLLGAVFLIVASVLAALHDHVYFLYFTAAAAGIQNGISSLYSANLIRSTHFTGTTTDMGLIVGQMLRGNFKDLWKLGVLVSLSVSFWFGGLVSFFATKRFTSMSLLFNAGLFLLIGMSLVAFLAVELQVSVRAAMFGSWKIKRAMEQLRLSADFWKSGLIDEEDPERSLDGLFEKIDTDGSGDIDLKELTIALNVVGIPTRDVLVIMKVVDTNGDGVISREEWRDACRKLMK